MSILTDFVSTDTIRLNPVQLNVIDPPRLLGGAPVIPPGLQTQNVPCITKMPGSLDATLVVLGITIPFRGTFLGTDSRGRWLVRWSIDDSTPRPFMASTIRRIQGQITMQILPTDPFRTDLTVCSGAPGEFFVNLQQAGTDEMGHPTIDEINIEADFVTRAHILIATANGDAGLAAPPPSPWPQPLWIRINTTCITSPRVYPIVSGEMRLDGPVLRSHTGFSVNITAEAVHRPRTLRVETSTPIGTSAFFEVHLPPDLIPPGAENESVRVTGFTNDRSHNAQTTFGVGTWSGIGCGGPWEVKYYNVIHIGCEAYDCGWTGINDWAELIGRSGGWAVRYLTVRRFIQRVADLLPQQAVLRAINNHGAVIGTLRQPNGKSDSFFYGESGSWDTPTKMASIQGVELTALNDAGTAVGSRFDGKHTIPVQWSNGSLKDIAISSPSAIATCIDGAGNIAGIHTPKENGPARAFHLDAKGFHDMGDPIGSVTTVSLNSAGALACSVLSGNTLRAIGYAPATGLFELKTLPGFDHSFVSGISNAGMIVGTAQGKSGKRTAFRYTTDRGLEDLNKFLDPASLLTIQSALAINNSGQILATGIQKNAPGYFLLTPASIPTPQIPIP